MQKNKKYYSFLLTHTTKSKIFIRRIEISKQILHSGFVVFLFSIVFATIGAFSLTRFPVLAKGDSDAGLNLATQQLAPMTVAEPRSADYSRPQGADGFALNSGGPDSDLQLTEDDIDQAKSGDVEKQLRLIQATADPTSLPTMWAHLGKINNEFGFRRNPFGGRSYEFHAGMDIDGEKGDTVIAPGGGKVVKSGWQGGYGNLIEIDHGNGITTRYGHLSKLEVEIGQTIGRGDLIGFVGSTGRSTGPHLHYELRLNDRPVNPRFFLPPEPTEIR